MCGRYALFQPGTVEDPIFERLFGTLSIARYNIAPEQQIPVWTKQGLDFVHWGMTRTVYHAAIKEAKQINTRLETMLSLPHQFSVRRCEPAIVIASGFFAWKTVATQKVPYFIQARTGQLIGLGALVWKDPVRKVWEGVTIITEPTTGPLGSVDPRKPLLFPQANWDIWLQSTPKKRGALEAYKLSETELVGYAVSKQVNDPQFNHHLAVQPLNS